MRDIRDYSIVNLWSTEKKERITNSNLVNVWNTERLEYQERYANLCIQHKLDPKNETYKGAMYEARYVLISIFGLTEKQVSEVEINVGATDNDLNNE